MALLIIGDCVVMFLGNFLPRAIISLMKRVKQVRLIEYKQVTKNFYLVELEILTGRRIWHPVSVMLGKVTAT
jgi:hypothetical protein